MLASSAVHYPICSPQSFAAYPALRADDEHQAPTKPFAMFAAISKVSLRQGEGILLYKYF